ncbi:hypothetical protein DL98DRAFT_595516 [Cadophora sp. DSE1049]|nr:hypothetical protein DL98DRAFT_595516 [Cadophora sp. DSE1049]
MIGDKATVTPDYARRGKITLLAGFVRPSDLQTSRPPDLHPNISGSLPLPLPSHHTTPHHIIAHTYSPDIPISTRLAFRTSAYRRIPYIFKFFVCDQKPSAQSSIVSGHPIPTYPNPLHHHLRRKGYQGSFGSRANLQHIYTLPLATHSALVVIGPPIKPVVFIPRGRSTHNILAAYSAVRPIQRPSFFLEATPPTHSLQIFFPGGISIE